MKMNLVTKYESLCIRRQRRPKIRTIVLLCCCAYFVIWLVQEMNSNDKLVEDSKRTKDPLVNGVTLEDEPDRDYTENFTEILATDHKIENGDSKINDGMLEAIDQSKNEHKAKHFIILSMPRSGVSVFKELMNRHPDLWCFDALLLEKRKPERLAITGGVPPNEALYKYIAESMKKKQLHVKLVGFKVTNVQLSKNNLTMKGLIDYFGQPNVIIVYRKDLLQQYLSLQLALARGKFNSRAKPNVTKVEVNWDAFTRYVSKIRQGYADSLSTFKEYPHQRTYTYEQIEKNITAVVLNALSFLNMRRSAQSFVPKLSKQNPKEISDKIENFDEVEKLIEGYGNQRFMDIKHLGTNDIDSEL
ncbi:unnamed protein product [Owenia fusiformis]|uniref:Uncharacterized protein n=1 Tax=Owenia fusiformis TaxID=6347 RepID=A0A8J1YD67_OWEFU|nr:unnamed protein product [Owenia fusiformis]